MKAVLKNFSQSPAKTRLVANAIRGKSVANALNILHGIDAKSAPVFEKLIRSAMANGGVTDTDAAEVRIESLVVDKGVIFKRIRPRARHTPFPIKKRHSVISLTLTK